MVKLSSLEQALSEVNIEELIKDVNTHHSELCDDYWNALWIDLPPDAEDAEQKLDDIENIRMSQLEERYTKIKLLSSRLGEHLDDLPIDPKLRENLKNLRKKGQYTFSRVAFEVLKHQINQKYFIERPLEPELFEDAPQIILVSPYRGEIANPPLGMVRTASFLELFGIKTHLIDLGIDTFDDVSQALNDKTWFVSLGDFNNPLQESDYKTIFDISDLVNKREHKPRLLAGGESAKYYRDDLLEKTPVEILFRQYGSLTLLDMIFNQNFKGPSDKRSNVELFGDVANLYIKSPKGVEPTSEIKYDNDSKRVVGLMLNPKKMTDPKHWGNYKKIDICSPLDFNPPPYLFTKDTRSKEIHPQDLYFQLNMARMVLSIGNCSRGCKTCSYTGFDPRKYFSSHEEMVKRIGDITALPEVELLGFSDDDFFHGRSDIETLLSFLSADKVTSGKVIYSIETIPQSIANIDLELLGDAGIRTILVGIESHSERVVRDIGKLRDEESWDDFIEAPKKIHDAGFYARTSIMFYYPIITEQELYRNISGLVDHIDYGISVILFPFVIPKKGISICDEPHKIRRTPFTLPNGINVNLEHLILPDNKVIREFAEQSVRETPEELSRILEEYSFGECYPGTLEVLAFFQNAVKLWKQNYDKVDLNQLTELDEKIKNSIASLADKSKIQLLVKDAIITKNPGILYSEIKESDGKIHPAVATTLRNYLDFGHDYEIITSARICSELLTNYELKDENMLSSLEFRAKHPNKEVSLACKNAIG